MKWLFPVVLLFGQAAYAQTTTPPVVPDISLPVKDSTGKVYPMKAWMDSVNTGRYVVTNRGPEGYLLLKPITAQERSEWISRMPSPQQSPFFRTGSSFAGFSEKDMDGNHFKLSELKGKVVVMNFWFVDCMPCRQEIPELNELVTRYRDRSDVVFIAFALDTKGAIRRFQKDMPFNYHIVPNSLAFAQRYRINSYPTHVVLNREGNVAFHTNGYSPATVSWIGKAINHALDEKPR